MQQGSSLESHEPDKAVPSIPPPPQTKIQIQSGEDVVYTTSTTIINNRAWANNCGIPFAALTDFNKSSSLRLQQLHRAPVRCKACSAYLHPYCRTNLAKHVWRCTFCNETNVHPDALASPDPLAYPELAAEAVEYVHPDQGAPPDADVRPHVVLVVDATMDDDSLLGPLRPALVEALQATYPPHTLVSVVGCDGVASLLSLGGEQPSENVTGEGNGEGAEGAPPPPPPPPPPSTVSAYTLPGNKAMDQAGVGLIARQGPRFWGELGAVGGEGGALRRALDSLRPLHTDIPQRQRPRCLGVGVEAALRLLAGAAGVHARERPQVLHPTSRVLVLAGGPITRGPGSVALGIVDGVDMPGIGAKEAAAVVTDAREHCMALARLASTLGAPIDVMLGGELGADVSTLSTLCKHSSGGELWGHASFASPMLASALTAALERRFGAPAQLDVFASAGVRLVQWLGSVDEVQQDAMASMPPIAKRLSSNACSVPAGLQYGRGAAARFELTQDIDEKQTPFVYVQLVTQFTEVGSGRLVLRVATRRLPVVATAAEFIRSVNPMAAAVVASKRLVLEARKGASGAAKGGKRDVNAMRRAEEEARLAAGAQLALVASRCGKEVVVSRGWIRSQKARVWPHALMPMAHVLYQLQRGRVLGGAGAEVSHPDERELLQAAVLSASASTALALVAPALYAIMPGEGEQQQGEGAPAAADGQLSQPSRPQVVLAPLPTLDVVPMACALPAAPGAGVPPALPTPPLLCDAGDTLLLLPPPAPAPGPTDAPTPPPTPFNADACLLAARQLVANRFPAPMLCVVQREGAAAGVLAGAEAVSLRALTPLCEPVHGDAWADQALQLSGMQLPTASQGAPSSSLAHLLVGGEQRCAAASNALAGGGSRQEPSLLQWARGLGVELLPPAQHVQ